MRILLLWDFYENYIREFYLHRPGAERLPFADQKQLLLADGINWASHMIPEFRKLGHQADIVIGNARPAQSRWAEENGLSGSASSAEIVREQIRQFRPDILWTCSAPKYLGAFLQSIKACCGNIVSWHAEWRGELRDWTGVDCILSSHANFVDMFRRMGLRSEIVLPCVNPEIVEACLSQAPERHREVIFYGTLSTATFGNRLRFLRAVTRRVHCEIYAKPIVWQRRPWPLRNFLTQLQHVPFALRNRFQPPVFGRDLLRLIASSKIVLNAHVDSADGLAGNIRMFEVTAMGALLLTDWSPNIAQLFEPGKEIVTYNNAADAVEKLRYYLGRPEELQAIASAGQQRTLGCHNSRVRAGEVLRIFEEIAGR